MKTKLIAVALVVSGVAMAAPPQQQPAPQGWGQQQQQQMGQGWQQQASPEQRAARDQRKRMMQVVGLTEALGLSTQDALRVDETIRKFDERRRPLKETVRESARVVMEAAKGDNAALSQVDQAINRVLDARVQLAQLDKEQMQALSSGLNAQQRAKLALFYARFHKGMRGGMGQDGSEGRFRPFRMRRGGQPQGAADAPASDPSASVMDADGSFGDDSLSL
ncbi:MAG TPA: hypothetical protein VFA20_33565 [Myxococcaceae bacterium]|nr:hypothetical protein [Myxococcaceae bacterium]